MAIRLNQLYRLLPFIFHLIRLHCTRLYSTVLYLHLLNTSYTFHVFHRFYTAVRQFSVQLPNRKIALHGVHCAAIFCFGSFFCKLLHGPAALEVCASYCMVLLLSESCKGNQTQRCIWVCICVWFGSFFCKLLLPESCKCNPTMHLGAITFAAQC